LADVAKKCCYQMVNCYPILLTNVFAQPGEMLKCKIASFLSHAVLVHCHTLTSRWLNLFSLVTYNSCCCCCVAPKSRRHRS